MSANAQSDSSKLRPDGRSKQPRPGALHSDGSKVGGLLHSEMVNRVTNPVLPEDLYREPIRSNGVVKMKGDYVRFFDTTDSLLHAISSVYNNSPTTRSIIRQKATLTLGDGFMLMQGRANSLFPTLAKQNVSVTDAKQIEAVDSVLMKVNADNETLSDVLCKTVMEFLTYGNAYIGMARAKAGKTVQCYSMPFIKGRVKERDDDGDLTEVGFNDEWQIRDWNDANLKRMPLYPTWSDADDDGVERTVIHLKDHAPGFEYYGLPEWISALEHAANEYRIPKHNGRKLVNRNRPNGILQIFGETSVEEAKKMVADIKKKFSTLGSNDGLLVQVLRDEKLAAKFTTLEDNDEGSYLELSRTSAQGIVTAHRWTMSLAGLATKGQLGTNEQIRREFEIAYSTVIRPIQNMMMRDFCNVFMSEVAKVNPAFKGLFLDVANSMPVSFVGDILIDQVLTTDEKRQIAGYEPLPKEGNSDQTAQTHNTVQTFSPLLANKMIEALEPAEIRQLLGFPANGSNTNTDANPA